MLRELGRGDNGHGQKQRQDEKIKQRKRRYQEKCRKVSVTFFVPPISRAYILSGSLLVRSVRTYATYRIAPPPSPDRNYPRLQYKTQGAVVKLYSTVLVQHNGSGKCGTGTGSRAGLPPDPVPQRVRVANGKAQGVMTIYPHSKL